MGGRWEVEGGGGRWEWEVEGRRGRTAPVGGWEGLSVEEAGSAEAAGADGPPTGHADVGGG